MDVQIKVDFRERPSVIMEILKEMDGVRLEEKKLSVGDYQINDHIFVERKTTKDFIVSLIDGRLFSQASRLKRFTERPVIIVEGKNLFHTGYAIDPQAVRGAIISLSTVWYIPVIMSKDLNDTAQFLILAGRQDIELQTEEEKRYGRKPRRLERRKLHILQGLPKIGPKIARKMLDHFVTVEKSISADETELALVEGIGKKKAAMIREVVG